MQNLPQCRFVQFCKLLPQVPVEEQTEWGGGGCGRENRKEAAAKTQLGAGRGWMRGAAEVGDAG